MFQPLPQKQVGKTRLRVPIMGLGTAHIAGFYGTDHPADKREAQAVKIVQLALESGMNFLDTAPLYKTEHYLGTALRGVPRDSYVIATKVGRLLKPDGDFSFNYSRDEILKSLEISLKNLKMDYVDILHIHDADDHYEIALNESFPALAELRSQGVIKAVGAGMNQWQMLADFARNADFDCFLLAGRYTLIEQTSLDALKLFHEKRISIFPGGVYNTGILATGAKQGAKYQYREAPPEILEKVRRIQAICDRYDVPLNAAAVQFVNAHPAVTSMVIGADSPEQIINNRKTLDVSIPAAFWSDLRAEGLVDPAAPLPGGVH
jgi:D-threo-aldose 1-dehydrogenase